MQPNEHSVLMTKKEKILITTLQLIAERGVEATPMSLIASESQVAIGTIYHHFKTKEEILGDILLEIRKTNQTIFQENIANHPTKRKQFVAVWKGMYQRYMDNPLVFHFTQFISRSKMIPEKKSRTSRQFFLILFNYFKEGIAEDVFIDINPRIMTAFIYNSILGYTELILTNQLEESEENLANAIEISWRAIRK